MDALLTIGRAIFLSLLVMEVLILLVRFSTCTHKQEFLLFLLVILFLAIKTFFSHLFFIGIGSSLILVYVTGNFIYTISPGKFNYLWTVSVALVSLIIVMLMILRLTQSFYFSLFYLYSTAMLLVYPLRQLWRLYKTKGSTIILLLLITSVFFILARSYDLISIILGWSFFDLTLWTSICLIICLGYIVFQKRYLDKEGVVGYNSDETRRNEMLHTVFSRIVQTEDTLLLQDRLITSGLLSAGTSHEFKNILTQIKLLSQFGLTQDDDKKKDDVIRAIAENTEHGINLVTEFFHILALKIEEQPVRINVKETLQRLIKLVRISYRRSGISFSLSIPRNMHFYCGRGELEQIMLNLIRNGVDSVNKRDPKKKRVEVHGSIHTEHWILDILDNGSGIPSQDIPHLFDPHFSGKKSSGLGLYLVKMLVQKNKGNIEYIPHYPRQGYSSYNPGNDDVPGAEERDSARRELFEPGACFRLIFPVSFS
jgi:signal transduction histidine kinase